MKIAIEGCLHGEWEKVYDTIKEIEDRENYNVDLVLFCGDTEASRNLSDLKCVSTPEHHRKMGTFYKYYSGELKAPILTLVIGGNHEASNHFQELPFGGWLCPNIYYLGYCGVVDLVDENGKKVLTVGGQSGIFKENDYLKGRFERTPYNESTKISVYHVRNIDEFRLNSMPPRSVDIMLSHDWPNGIQDFGNFEQLIPRFLSWFQEDTKYRENDDRRGSIPAMRILKHLKPRYWFSGHIHCKYEAIFEDTKFLALDKCLPDRKFLEIIDKFEDVKSLKLSYNPKWLAILKSTNELQSSSYEKQHMPSIECPRLNQIRFDYTPNEEELAVIKRMFEENYIIPQTFDFSAKVFDPITENDIDLSSICYPEPQMNPQTKTFCDQLDIDDPIDKAESSPFMTSDFKTKIKQLQRHCLQETEEYFTPKESISHRRQPYKFPCSLPSVTRNHEDKY